MISTFRLLAAACIALFAFSAFADDPPAIPRAERDTRTQEKRADLMGRVTAVSPDGHSLTLSMPPRPGADGQPAARDAQGEQAVVLLSDKTKMLFFGVSDGRAHPEAGQMAMVWLEEGTKDQAARVRFMKREGEERPDIQGRIVAVSADGRMVTVETRDDRGDKPTGKIDLHLAPYTQSLYYGVDKDAARPTPDYQVVAWLEKGSKDTPVRIRFMKNDPQDARDRREPITPRDARDPRDLPPGTPAARP